MFVPLLNVALGVAMIVGGVSGELALFGTGSSTALGVFQLVRAARGR